MTYPYTIKPSGMSLYRIHKFFFFFFSVSVFKFSDGQSQAMGAVSLRYTLI